MPAPLMLSTRAGALQPSLTLAIAAKARQLRADGHDICSLSAGEPDFDTPAFIRQAASEALESGHTRYGPVAGEPALRQAIATKLSEENGVPTTAEEVLVTNGGKQALYNLFQVLLGPGDEVLVPSPYWLSYPEMVQLAGARVTLLPSNAAQGFRLDPTALEVTNREVMEEGPDGRKIVCTDSITFGLPEDVRNIIVSGGHNGRSSADYIGAINPFGYICSDGGGGRDGSGRAALPKADELHIAGATVDAGTARMGDGHSTWNDGVISGANKLAEACGVRIGMRVPEAARLLVRRKDPTRP